MHFCPLTRTSNTNLKLPAKYITYLPKHVWKTYRNLRYFAPKMSKTEAKVKKIHIYLASDRVNPSISSNHRIPRIFTPGEIVTEQNELMK